MCRKSFIYNEKFILSFMEDYKYILFAYVVMYYLTLNL